MAISGTKATAESIPAMFRAETAFPAVSATARALVNAIASAADWEIVKGLSARAPEVLAAALDAAKGLDGIPLTPDQLETVETQLGGLQRAAASFSKLTPSINTDGSNAAAAKMLVREVEAAVAAAAQATSRAPDVVLADFRRAAATFRSPSELVAALLALKNPAEVGPLFAALFGDDSSLVRAVAGADEAPELWLYRLLAYAAKRHVAESMRPAWEAALSAGYEVMQRRPARRTGDVEAFVDANLPASVTQDPRLRPANEVRLVVHPDEIANLLEARVHAAPMGARTQVLQAYASSTGAEAVTADVAAAWTKAISAYAPHA